jgi:hypothetical protein
MGRRPNQTEINQFKQFTNCSNRTFIVNHLQKHNNNINAAVNAYFAEGHSSKYTANEATLKAVFAKYKGNGGKMGQDGIVAFFKAAAVPLQDILPVIFSCEGQASAMGVYTEMEFVRAMTCLGLESENDFKNNAKTIKAKYLNDKSLFNRVWKYSFGYMAQGAKYVNKQLCAMMIGVIGKGKYALADRVVAFLGSDAVRNCPFYYKVLPISARTPQCTRTTGL